MSLTAVQITEESFLTCLTHAVSSETEEIMGLLFGEIEYSNHGSVTALVWGVAPQTRSDRRKDRVETNPEQLAAATSQAERMSVEVGRPTRVIGWYHSHPHITVMPSHVDVRTQRMYQMLDPGFVGLIFSCFNEDGIKGGRIQVIAFQSSDGRSPRDTPFRNPRTVGVPAANASTVIGLPALKPIHRSNSRKIASDSSTSETQALDQTDGTDSKGGGQQDQALALHQLFTLSDSEAGKSRPAAVLDEDAGDLSGNLQEAMVRSNLEYSGGDYMRKEVPLQVVPGPVLLGSGQARSSLLDLQRILYTEEQTAYNQALINCTRDGRMHPLAAVHHSATYQASLAKLMEYCLSSVFTSLMDKHHQNQVRAASLQEEIDGYQASTKSTSGLPSGRLPTASPSRASEPHARERSESEVVRPPMRGIRHSSYSALNAAVQERKERRSSLADVDLIEL